MSLENIAAVRGILKRCFEQVDPATILHSDEIQEKRLADKEFRKLGSWTADFPLYTLEGQEAVLYLARRDNNLIFQNIDDAVEQIHKTQNYKVNSDNAQRAITAETTLRIPLSELKLERYDNECNYFTINTSKYNKLNPTQKTFAERVHGAGEQFGKVMEMLSNASIGETRIYTLNPDYVKKEAKDSPIARVCWLDNFEDYPSFLADYRSILDFNGALRGVRSVVAESSAQKNVPFSFSYNNK